MRRRIGFFEHSETDERGLLGQRASELDFDVVRVRADDLSRPLPEAADLDVLVVLGSHESVYDPGVGWIARERQLLCDAVAGEVPILGVCFGGQLLAEVLGAAVRPARQPELGWQTIRSTSPALIGSGPWLLWHKDAFSVPVGATEIATSDVCAQAFVLGPHLGLQFHPEVTPGVIDCWTAEAVADGLLDREAVDGLRVSTLLHAGGAADRARHLFDAFLQRAGAISST